MSILTLLVAVVILAVVGTGLWFWLRANVPLRSKILLPLSLFIGIPGTIMIFSGILELGTALTGLAGFIAALEARARRKKEATDGDSVN